MCPIPEFLLAQVESEPAGSVGVLLIELLPIVLVLALIALFMRVKLKRDRRTDARVATAVTPERGVTSLTAEPIEKAKLTRNCPECGRDLIEPPVWCKCGRDYRHKDPRTKYLVADRPLTRKERRWRFVGKYRWVDDEGFIRKYRRPVEGIGCLLMVMGAGTVWQNMGAPKEIVPILVVLFIAWGCAQVAVAGLTTYDLKTWQTHKSVEAVVGFALLFCLLPAIPVYYLLKSQERRYLQSLRQKEGKATLVSTLLPQPDAAGDAERISVPQHDGHNAVPSDSGTHAQQKRPSLIRAVVLLFLFYSLGSVSIIVGAFCTCDENAQVLLLFFGPIGLCSAVIAGGLCLGSPRIFRFAKGFNGVLLFFLVLGALYTLSARGRGANEDFSPYIFAFLVIGTVQVALHSRDIQQWFNCKESPADAMTACTPCQAASGPTVDEARWYHALVGFMLPYVALPWGIVSLIRGKRRSGGLLVYCSTVIIVVAVVTLVVVNHQGGFNGPVQPSPQVKPPFPVHQRQHAERPAVGRADELTLHSDKANGFTILYPKTWQLFSPDEIQRIAEAAQPTPSKKYILGVGSPDRTINMQIVTEKLDAGMTPNQYFDHAWAMGQETSLKWQIKWQQVGREEVRVGDSRGVKHTIVATYPDGRHQRAATLHLVRGQTGWSVIIGGRPEAMEKAGTTVDRMLTSMSFPVAGDSDNR